jgi:hypothetical protein
MLPLRPFHPGDSVHEIDGTLQGVVLRTSPSGVVVECLDGLEHFFKADELVHDFPWSVGQGVPPQSIAQQKGDAAPRKHAEKVQRVDLHLPENDNGHRALERQLAKLRSALGASGWDRVVVVHGVGEGILRNAVHTFVRNETPYRIGKSSASETEVIRL